VVTGSLGRTHRRRAMMPRPLQLWVSLAEPAWARPIVLVELTEGFTTNAIASGCQRLRHLCTMPQIRRSDSGTEGPSHLPRPDCAHVGRVGTNADTTGASAQYESELTASPPARVASFCQTPSCAAAVNERFSVMLKVVGVVVMVAVST
jgi:hypothetical protein